MMPAVIIVCRRASDSLIPGSALGYTCKYCGKELQVSAEGRNQIAAAGERALVLCNDCGFKKGMELAKGEKLGGVVFTPEAVKQAEKQGIPIEDLLGRKKQ
jgi:hypothetical protein